MPVVRGDMAGVLVTTYQGAPAIVLTGPAVDAVRSLRREWEAVSKAADCSIAARHRLADLPRGPVGSQDEEAYRHAHRTLHDCEDTHARIVASFEGAATGLGILLALAKDTTGGL